MRSPFEGTTPDEAYQMGRADAAKENAEIVDKLRRVRDAVHAPDRYDGFEDVLRTIRAIVDTGP